jgi:hypothetical protein
VNLLEHGLFSHPNVFFSFPFNMFNARPNLTKRMYNRSIYIVFFDYFSMAKQYGPIVRYYFAFGRERVMLADPDAMKHVLVTNCKNYIKPPSRLA